MSKDQTKIHATSEVMDTLIQETIKISQHLYDLIVWNALPGKAGIIKEAIEQELTHAYRAGQEDTLKDYLYGIQKLQGILSRFGHEQENKGEAEILSTVNNLKVEMKLMISELQITINRLSNPDKKENK